MAPNNLYSSSYIKHVCKLHTSHRPANSTSNSHHSILIYIIR